MKRRRKTIEQRFEDWWKRRGYERYLWGDGTKAYMRIAYYNGWAARTRTKDRP